MLSLCFVLIPKSAPQSAYGRRSVGPLLHLVQALPAEVIHLYLQDHTLEQQKIRCQIMVGFMVAASRAVLNESICLHPTALLRLPHDYKASQQATDLSEP